MKNVILFILTAIVVSSCSTLDKSRMLKTPTNYKFKAFADSINYKKPYKIAVDDEVAVQMYSNDGYSIISLTSGGGSGGGVEGGGGGGFGKSHRDGRACGDEETGDKPDEDDGRERALDIVLAVIGREKVLSGAKQW